MKIRRISAFNYKLVQPFSNDFQTFSNDFQTFSNDNIV